RRIWGQLRTAGLGLGLGRGPMRFPRLITNALLLIASGAVSGQSLVNSLSNTADVRNVFVVAHQDDWQLFMGDVAAQAVRTTAPATFIYLTAGDDGRDSVYWNTRERAALQSTRVVVGLETSGSDTTGCTSVPVLEHSIRKCVVGNTKSFFLRLP